MLRKKEVYTNITPIPKSIPRQLAIDILHSHVEIITLNPLVLEHRPTKAPRDAPADEFYCTWYEIIERIQYVPGMGKMGSGKISFKGCFHDMPWGLQTHIYAPMGIDIKNKWQICGNQPGEPFQIAELGIGAPAEGLYLREDIEIKCNITLVSFVKAQLKAASKILVDRLIKKAELLDSGALLAMMENGRLRTVNPADRTQTTGPLSHEPIPQPPMSPGMPYNNLAQPHHYGRPPSGGHSPNMYPQHLSPQPPRPQHQQNQQHQQHASIELPGDTYYHDPRLSPNSTHLQPSYSPHQTYASLQSDYSGSPDVPQNRWSDYYQSQLGGSRPVSYNSDVNAALRSPNLDQKFPRPTGPTELPAMAEERPQAPPLPAKEAA